MIQEIAEWAEQNGLDVDGEYIYNKHDHIFIEVRRDERVIVHDSGDMAVQGRFSEVDGEWLYIEGERYAWDEGPVQFEGTFAVSVAFGGYPEIDGPVPER